MQMDGRCQYPPLALASTHTHTHTFQGVWQPWTWAFYLSRLSVCLSVFVCLSACSLCFCPPTHPPYPTSFFRVKLDLDSQEPVWPPLSPPHPPPPLPTRRTTLWETDCLGGVCCVLCGCFVGKVFVLCRRCIQCHFRTGQRVDTLILATSVPIYNLFQCVIEKISWKNSSLFLNG